MICITILKFLKYIHLLLEFIDFITMDYEQQAKKALSESPFGISLEMLDRIEKGLPIDDLLQKWTERTISIIKMGQNQKNQDQNTV
jgi:hypothetical protein